MYLLEDSSMQMSRPTKMKAGDESADWSDRFIIKGTWGATILYIPKIPKNTINSVN